MTDQFPCDSEGNRLDAADGTQHRSAAWFNASHPSVRLSRLVNRRVARALQPLAEGMRDAIAETRAEIEARAQREIDEARAVLAAEIATLRDEVKTLRAELGRERAMAEIVARLDRLETGQRGLRAV